MFSVSCCSTDSWYLPPAVCGFFLLLIPLWVIIARQSQPIREVLKSGWQPVILAMSISRWAHFFLFFSFSFYHKRFNVTLYCISVIAIHQWRLGLGLGLLRVRAVFVCTHSCLTVFLPVSVAWFWIKQWAIQTLKAWQCSHQSSTVSRRCKKYQSSDSPLALL